MNIIDTHCHLHDPEFFTTEAAEVALKRAVKSGVTKLILVSTSLEDSKRAIAFAHKYPENCFASIGIHPHEAVNMNQKEIVRHIAELAELAADPKVVAVGECGFDFYYNDKNQALALQEQLLR